MPSFDVAIECRGIHKHFDLNKAVNGIDLEINKGECFGVLGPNGAGKTTLMRLMYCSSRVTSGDLFVLNLSTKDQAKQIKSRIGVVPQDDGLDPDFSVLENMLVFATYHKIAKRQAQDRSMELLRDLQIEDILEKPVATLSGGMRRRLVLARALINRPEILFLDEPTTGLDPDIRLWFWDTLRTLKAKGTTLVLNTHYMEEAETLCDRIALMESGKILSQGTPEELVKSHAGWEVVEFTSKESDMGYFISRLRQNFFQYLAVRNRIFVFLHQGQDSKKALESVFGDSVTVRKANLNDVFLKLAGHEIKEDH